MHMYLEHKSLAHIIKFSSNIYHCSATNLNLSQYILARQTICQQQHAKPCKECDALLFIANYILKNGFISLSKAFHEVFPSIKYCAEVRSMQKILANASRVYCSGGPKIWPVTLLPHRNHSDINYQGIYRLLMSQKDSGDPKHISKSALKDVLYCH